MNELNLYSGGGPFRSPGRDIARRQDVALQMVDARAEVAHAEDTARAALTASALNHLGAIGALASQVVQEVPVVAPEARMLLRGYAMSAAFGIERLGR